MNHFEEIVTFGSSLIFMILSILALSLYFLSGVTGIIDLIIWLVVTISLASSGTYLLTELSKPGHIFGD